MRVGPEDGRHLHPLLPNGADDVTGVNREQRHTRARRCPVCDGADGDPRGKSKRCGGFTSSDGTYVHCSREDFAGGIAANNAGLFAHRMQGSCKCGTSHGTWTGKAESIVEARYPYVDENGTLLYEVIRKPGKQFRQRKPDGAGGWEWKLNGVRRVPYRLREVLAADPEQVVFIVEGEKDVESLEKRRHVATCNPGGAGKWAAVAQVAATMLQGRDVAVVADRDEVGRAHAEEVATSLRGVARSVLIFTPPAPYKDITDMFDAGKSEMDLVGDGEMPSAAGTRFREWTMEEIWAPLEPPVWVVKGLLLQANLGLLVAYGSSFKTWEMVDVALAVATGGDALGRFPCVKGRALIVDWESGDYELRRRFQAVAKGRGHHGPVPGVSFITMPDLFFTSKDFEVELEKLCQGRAIVCFDSLAAGSVDVEENDSAFAQGLQACKRVASRTGCSILVLHHARKSSGDSNDERQLVRGSGAIFATADSVTVLLKQEGYEAFLCKSIKSRGGKHVDPFIVRVEDQPDGGIRVFATDHLVAKPKTDDAKEANYRSVVLQEVATNHKLHSANEVWKAVGHARREILDAVKTLLRDKLIILHDGVFRLASEVVL